MLVIALVVWAGGGDGGDGGSQSANKVPPGASPACGYQIAYLGAVTGENADNGITIRDSAQLAVDEYKKRHAGCEVKLRVFDARAADKRYSEAQHMAQQIVEDPKILGVVGPVLLSEVLAAGPVLDQGDVPLITPAATDNELSRKGWKVFHRALGNDSDQALAGARYLKSVLKASKTVIVWDETAFGGTGRSEVRHILREAVIDEISIKRYDKDHAAAVKRVVDATADSVYFAGAAEGGGTFVKQLRAASPKIAVVSGSKIMNTGFLNAVGSAAEGVVATCPCLPIDQAAQDFAANFKKRFPTTPSLMGPEAYDATNIFLSGLNAGKATRKDMLAYVNAYAAPGIAREIKFTVNGDLDVRDLQIWTYKVHNGRFIADQTVSVG